MMQQTLERRGQLGYCQDQLEIAIAAFQEGDARTTRGALEELIKAAQSVILEINREVQ